MTRNVYILYLNDLLTGSVDKKGEYGSFTESNQYIDLVIDEFVRTNDIKNYIIIPKTGKVDNALLTVGWKTGYVIHKLEHRVEIYERYIVRPGYLVNTYNVRMVATIGCLEIILSANTDMNMNVKSAPINKPIAKLDLSDLNSALQKHVKRKEAGQFDNVDKLIPKKRPIDSQFLKEIKEKRESLLLADIDALIF